MPETSDGKTVYTDPERLERYVQTTPDTFSLSTDDSSGVSEWRKFLESLQTQAKAQIDSICDRDFEYHQDETVSISREAGNNVFYIPNPVDTVHKVTIDGTEIDPEHYLVKSSGTLTFPDRDYVVSYLGTEQDGLTDEPNFEYGEYGDDIYGYEDIITISLDYGFQSPPEHIVKAELELVAHEVIRLSDMAEEAVMEQEEPAMSGGLMDNIPQSVMNILEREKDIEMFI